MIFSRFQRQLVKQNLEVIGKDCNRPWGGFFLISEQQAQSFADIYLEGINVSSLKISGKLSPKILIVAPGKRLSWQYHQRRAEIWRVFHGSVGIKRSRDDVEGDIVILKVGDIITLQEGERHRLVGLDDYAVIAEIWQHTDANNPSDEEDIVRLQDDFGR